MTPRRSLRDRIQDQKLLRSATASLFQDLQREAQVVNVMNDPHLRKQYPGVAATINGQQITRQQVARVPSTARSRGLRR